MVKMTKKEKMDMLRAEVMEMFADKLTGEDSEFTQIDSGAFVIPMTDAEGEEKFVEIKFVVKGDTFDFEDAVMAYEDKVAKATEREQVKAQKAAERLAKEKEKEAKAKAKNSEK